jgi:uncharacterized membrane protein YccC
MYAELLTSVKNEGKRSSWAVFWQSVTRVEPEKATPWLALRNSIGITLPLAIGLITGAVSSGVIATTGALNVSFSDSEDPYRQRGRRMLASTLLVGIAVFVGSLSGQNHLLAILLATCWAFAAGMLVALSGGASDLGVISLVTVVVFAATPMTPERALYSGLLAMCGGLLQTMLSVALWPVRRYDPERRVLGDLYTELSRVAASPIEASQAPPASGQSTHAQSSIAALARDHSINGERYRSLLSQAERARLSLLTLTRLRARLAREEEGKFACEILDRVFPICSRVLGSIGNWLAAGEIGTGSTDSLQELHKLSQGLKRREEEMSSSLIALIEDARHQLDALTGQLRSAADLAAYATPTGVAAFKQREERKPWSLRVSGPLATLGANLNFRSAACRHAVRLAVCIAVGVSLAAVIDWRRSYWIPMTIAIVLKPDFTATFSRGVLRLAGTFLGLVLATGLFHLLPGSIAPEVALIAILSFVLRCFGPANYGIFVCAVTALVVVMLAANGVAPSEVIAARGLNSAVGGVIALLAYWIWPTWERTQISETMAQMLDAYRVYFRAVRDRYAKPDTSITEELDSKRVAGRLARSNLEASIDRIIAEPGTSAARVSALSAMLASSHRVVHAMMALEAGLSSSHPVPARENFHTFANDVEMTLYYLAAALRGSPIHKSELPDLREAHHSLVETGDSLTERYALVNVETDRITNSLNTLSEQILNSIKSAA